MYPALLNQSPPAPYQMQSPSQSPSQPAPAPTGTASPTMQPQYNMPQSYAHGGRPKRGKMVLAHMSPKELNVLDHVQGKQERCPRSNLRSYSHLEELLKNPHILHKVHQHVQHHSHGGSAHAHGGDVHGNGPAEAANGVHGDTELAMIGPHTHQVFNHLARMQGYKEGDLVNSHDGRPQYWSLGNALGGVWNSIKGTAGNVANQAYDIGKKGVQGVSDFANAHPELVRGLGSAAQSVLPMLTKEGTEMATESLGPLGGLAAQGLGALGGAGADYLSKFGLPEGGAAGSDTAQQMGGAAGKGMNAAYDQYQQNRPTQEERQPGFIGPQRGPQNFFRTAGAALSGAGGSMPGSIGGAMNGVGTGMHRGDTAGRTAGLGAQGAWMGSQGQSGVADAAKNLMTRFGQAGSQSGGQAPRQTGGQSVPSSIAGNSSMRQMLHGNVQHPGMNPNNIDDLYT